MGSGVTTGIDNIGIGINAYGTAVAGGHNIAIGTLSMGGALVTSSDNIAIGNQAMDAITSGS